MLSLSVNKILHKSAACMLSQYGYAKQTHALRVLGVAGARCMWAVLSVLGVTVLSAAAPAPVGQIEASPLPVQWQAATSETAQTPAQLEAEVPARNQIQARPAAVLLQPPYEVGINSTQLFQEIWRTILIEAKIPHKFIVVPYERRRRAFEEGSLVMACCSAMRWRSRPGELETQIFSDPVMTIREYYVFQDGVQINRGDKAAMKAHLFVGIGGFTYEDIDETYNRMDVADWDELFRVFTAGRGDFTLINDAEYIWRADKYGGDIQLGPLHDTYSLRVRVRREYEHLLEPINSAIARLRARDAFWDIVRSGGKSYYGPIDERLRGQMRPPGSNIVAEPTLPQTSPAPETSASGEALPQQSTQDSSKPSDAPHGQSEPVGGQGL